MKVFEQLEQVLDDDPEMSYDIHLAAFDVRVSLVASFLYFDRQGCIRIWAGFSHSWADLSPHDRVECWESLRPSIEQYVQRLSRKRVFRELCRLQRVPSLPALFQDMRNIIFTLYQQRKHTYYNSQIAEETNVCSSMIPLKIVQAWARTASPR